MVQVPLPCHNLHFADKVNRQYLLWVGTQLCCTDATVINKKSSVIVLMNVFQLFIDNIVCGGETDYTQSKLLTNMQQPVLESLNPLSPFLIVYVVYYMSYPRWLNRYSLPSMLVSRFLINLRQVDLHDGSPSTASVAVGHPGGRLSAVRLHTSIVERVIGTMGESLDHSTHTTWDNGVDEIAEADADFVQNEDGHVLSRVVSEP